MEMKISKILFIVVLTSFFTSSCRTDKKAIAENDIQFDSITVDKTYHLLEQPANPACNLRIKFTYPVKFGNKEVLSQIRKHFIASCFGDMYEELTPEQAVDEYVNIYLEDYKGLEDDFTEEKEKSEDAPVASWFSYYETSYNEITFNKANLLCYSIVFENYTGGAHGAHTHTNVVLNLQTGKIVTEEDIFIEGFQDALALMLVDKIAKQNEVEDARQLESIGFFSADEIFPNGNFLVDEEGITYYFNEYEIAAYVVGVTRVKLLYSDMKPLLKKDSPVSTLIRD
ncbi:MAG: DUF3298 and DUF4163 domain-containing protein [Tannerellaceae bacterium]|jgi:hypothetical protein|nr:DUF3298 and DUF4163 domain-containing protein [Tannerellaceae bacterium]